MISNTLFCNVQSYITRWLVIRWNLKFKWVFIQIYSSWIIPQKNNLVLKIYDLDDVPLVSKDNLAEEAQKVILAIMKSFWFKNSTFTFCVWVLGQVDHCDENFWIVKYSKICSYFSSVTKWCNFKRLQDISIYICVPFCRSEDESCFIDS